MVWAGSSDADVVRQWPKWFLVIAAVALLGAAYVALTGSLGDFPITPGGDYAGPACSDCDSAGPPLVALAHGHVGMFFSSQPVMGSASIVLRAPFVALVTWFHGDFTAQYRTGVLVCLLATVLLLLPAVRLMLRRGQQPVTVVVVLATIVVGPATFKAIAWGHPEELLAPAFAVAAVLAAIHRRGVLAGVLLGLAVATKQWGVFAVLPVLMVASGQRRQVAVAATAVAAGLMVPMLVGDPKLFITQNFDAASAQLGVTPTNLWWPLHHPGFDPSIHQQMNVIPSLVRSLTHPLVIVLGLGLSGLYWRRSANRSPYDALELLALLFLVRCVLDPLTISYHHAPFLLTIAVYEGLRRRGLPILTLISTAMMLVLARLMVPLGDKDLMYVVYLAWVLPTVGYLTASTLGRRIDFPTINLPTGNTASPQSVIGRTEPAWRPAGVRFR